MTDASSDHGSVLPPGTWGIIWHPDDGWSLLVPKSPAGPNELVPPEGLAMTGTFLKLERDDDFRKEMAHYFKNIGKS